MGHVLIDRSSVKSRKLVLKLGVEGELISDSSTDTITQINWSRSLKSLEQMSYLHSTSSLSLHDYANIAAWTDTT